MKHIVIYESHPTCGDPFVMQGTFVEVVDADNIEDVEWMFNDCNSKTISIEKYSTARFKEIKKAFKKVKIDPKSCVIESLLKTSSFFYEPNE